MWEEYMDQRKQARVKEEEDLKKLKERQVSADKIITQILLMTFTINLINSILAQIVET